MIALCFIVYLDSYRCCCAAFNVVSTAVVNVNVVNVNAVNVVWTAVVCVRTPSISYISRDIEVDIESSAELECSVQYVQNFPVLWLKKGTNGHQVTMATRSP